MLLMLNFTFVLFVKISSPISCLVYICFIVSLLRFVHFSLKSFFSGRNDEVLHFYIDRREVNGTVILPPLVFPGSMYVDVDWCFFRFTPFRKWFDPSPGSRTPSGSSFATWSASRTNTSGKFGHFLKKLLKQAILLLPTFFYLGHSIQAWSQGFLQSG